MEENVEDPLQNPEAIVKLVTKTGRQSGADGENGPAENVGGKCQVL